MFMSLVLWGMFLIVAIISPYSTLLSLRTWTILFPFLRWTRHCPWFFDRQICSIQTMWQDVLACDNFQLQSPTWHTFPEKVLHSSLHNPWSKEALGLGLVLFATRSRTHSARDWCQSFQCHQPINILTSWISHPCIWWYSCHSSHNAYKMAEWSQPLSNMQHQRYLHLLHLLCPPSMW